MPERPRPTRSRKLVDLTVDEMVRIASAFSRSGRFTIKERGAQPRPLTAEEVFVIILAGQELGVGPSQSVMGIKMIEGKPEISAGLMAGMVKNSGRYDYRTEFGTDDDKWCAVTFYDTNDGEAIGVSRFDEKMKNEAGLGRKAQSGADSNYDKYWRNMYFARALSNGVKWYVPDALMVSAYHEGEIEGDTDAPVPELPQQPTQTVIGPSATITSPISNTTLSALPVSRETEAADREPAVVPNGKDDPYTRSDEEIVDANQIELDYDPVTPVEPTVTQGPQERTISPKQIGFAHALAKAANLTDERRREIMVEETGVSHTDRIPMSKFDAFKKRLEQEATLQEAPE